MNIDIKQLESLLQDKRYDEVQKIITESIASPLSDQEKGAILVDFASAYMKIVNSINIKYRDALKEAIVGIGLINKAETEVVDRIKLEEVKKGLGIA